MAIRLAKDGFNIAVNFRGEPERQDALDVQALVRENGSEAEIFGCDVSDFSACKEMTKNVKERFSTIDVLVNNAGITKDGLLARMSEEQFDIVTAVNYKSVFNMTRYVSGVMIKQRSGRIINISSVAGVYGNPGQFNYSASKAGIIGMTLTAAKELGARNITVNAIAPGLIETPMTDSLSEELKSRMLDAVSLGRFGSPQDVAGAVSFLAGEDSAYITGQVLVVDGGLII
ncbi:MAG: 3-oxoacyl-ACP reductase FabG [Oscillospiraceae bacterium]|nr:3-oxoacyl-ACP reductase FabG [Oscillospiraceae bacterium]